MSNSIATVQLVGHLSPACTLPLELLSEIFQAYLAQSYRKSIIIEIVYDVNLWKLGHVCSSWRAALLSAPHLWSTFADYPLYFEGMNPAHEARRQARLTSCLERSRSHPISFYEADLAFLPELAKESYRWQKAELSPTKGELKLSLFRGEFPKLRSLAINPDYNFPLNLQDFDFLERAPILSHLSLSQTIIIPHTYTAPTTLNHLTSLNLSQADLHPSGLSNLLLSTPNLIEFNWTEGYGIDTNIIYSDIKAPVVLPHLRVLRLSFSENGHEWLLAHLTAPRLDTLAIFDYNFLGRSFPVFFERSAIHGLSEFAVTGSMTETIIEIIKGLKFVKKVVIEHPVEPQRILRAVLGFRDDPRSPLLPEIGELSIRGLDSEWMVKKLDGFRMHYEPISLQDDRRAGYKVFLRNGQSITLYDDTRDEDSEYESVE